MVANGPLQACRSMESPAKLVEVRHRGEVANAPCGRQARHVQAVARTDETVGAADTKEQFTRRSGIRIGSANSFERLLAVGRQRDKAVGEYLVFFLQMLRKRPFHERHHRCPLAPEGPVDVVAEFVSQSSSGCAWMVGGVHEDNELGVAADAGAAEESAQREARALRVRPGAPLDLSPAVPAEDSHQALRAVVALPLPTVAADRYLHPLRECPQQLPGRKSNIFKVVSRQNFLEIG